MYTLHATFDAQVDQEETLAAVLEVLPEGSAASLQREPVILDVPDLDETHVGSSIRARIAEFDEFGGPLEAIYPGENGGMLVIVDGKPHTLKWWETVQVLPPVTEGQHTADEPEVEAEDEFNMAPDDYNQAIDIAFRMEEALADYITPVAWLSRGAVEAVAGRVVTDDEYQTVAAATREQLTNVVTPVAGSLIARNLELYAAYQEGN